MVGCATAPNLVVLGASLALLGVASSVFGLARQAYLTEVVPIHAGPRPVDARRRQPDRHLRRAVRRRPRRRALGTHRGLRRRVRVVDGGAAVRPPGPRRDLRLGTTTEYAAPLRRRGTGRASAHPHDPRGRGALHRLGARVPDRTDPAVRGGDRAERRPDQPRRRHRGGRGHAALLPGRRGHGPVRPDVGRGPEHARPRRRHAPAAARPLVRDPHRRRGRPRRGQRDRRRARDDAGCGRLAGRRSDAVPRWVAADGRPRQRVRSGRGQAITVAFPLAAAAVVMGGAAFVGAGWLRVWLPRFDPISRRSAARDGPPS